MLFSPGGPLVNLLLCWDPFPDLLILSKAFWEEGEELVTITVSYWWASGNLNICRDTTCCADKTCFTRLIQIWAENRLKSAFYFEGRALGFRYGGTGLCATLPLQIRSSDAAEYLLSVRWAAQSQVQSNDRGSSDYWHATLLWSHGDMLSDYRQLFKDVQSVLKGAGTSKTKTL